jgi:cysteine desulfurase/selenocysteine lyase
VEGAVGLAAAVGYLQALGMDRVHAHETALVRYATERLATIEDLTLLGPPAVRRGGLVSFTLRDVHPHDLSQLLDAENIAVRAGHHCAQPLMRALGVNATTRASFYVYNDSSDVDALVSAVAHVRERFAATV